MEINILLKASLCDSDAGLQTTAIGKKWNCQNSRFIFVFIPLILALTFTDNAYFLHVFPTTLPEEQIPCLFEVKLIERPSGFTYT